MSEAPAISLQTGPPVRIDDGRIEQPRPPCGPPRNRFRTMAAQATRRTRSGTAAVVPFIERAGTIGELGEARLGIDETDVGL